MTAVARWAPGSLGRTITVAVLIGLLAFAIFGPLLNLLLWAFAERWYFPNRIPSVFGVSFWGRVFSERGGAVSSLATSVWISCPSRKARRRASSPEKCASTRNSICE